MNHKPLSLKARAIALLAQREHSPSELRRKLLRIENERRRQESLREGKEVGDDGSQHAAPELVDELLSWLQAQLPNVPALKLLLAAMKPRAVKHSLTIWHSVLI